MTREEEQQQLRAAFVDRVLFGTDDYPPPGWHDIHGDTGKSALIWSLCRWRSEANGRATLILPMAEPYDYAQVCDWAGMDPRLVIWTRRNHNLLGYAKTWIQTGLIGQVVMEGLGFLLGSGKIDEYLSWMLGPVEQFGELARMAQHHDVALYTTSYSVTALGGGPIKTHALGGRLLLDLCVRRRLFLSHGGYHLAGGRTVGEYLTVANLLNKRNRHARFEIRYDQGPVRLRRPYQPQEHDPGES